LGRIEKSIEIKAPLEKVWEALAFDRHPEFFEEYQSAKYTSEVHTPEDKYRVGASARITTKHKEEVDINIIESLKNKKITYRVQGMPAARNIIGSFILKSTGAGTEITITTDYEMPWSILGKVIDKLLGQRMLEKDTVKTLDKMKSILEK
jgi:uncharacterized membrane protein